MKPTDDFKSRFDLKELVSTIGYRLTAFSAARRSKQLRNG